MAGTDINIGSLLFDVGVDPAQVRKLTGEMRQMGQTAKEAFERPRKAADPLKQSVEKIRNEIYGLRSAYIAGTVSEKQFRQEMTRLKGEALGTARGLGRTSKEFRQLNIAAATAERGLATLRGEASRLGLASQVNIALNQRMNASLMAMGPAGSAAALGITAVGNAAVRTQLLISTGLLVGVGALTLAMHKGLMKASEYADAVDKNSQSAGLSVEAYQELAFAFDQSGISADQFRQALGSLNRRLGEAAQGNKAYADAYKRLGIDIRTANGGLRESEEIIVEALDALGRLPSSAQQASLAAKIFGDDVGKKLVPVIRQGAEGIEELRQRARDLGLVMDEQSIAGLVNYADRVAAVKDQWAALGRELSISTLPLMEGILGLVEHGLVPQVRNMASGLTDFNDRLLDTTVTGAAFQEVITGHVTELIRVVTAVEMVSTGLDLLNVKFQLLGARGNQFLRGLDSTVIGGVRGIFGMETGDFGLSDTNASVAQLARLLESLEAQLGEQIFQWQNAENASSEWFTTYQQNLLRARELGRNLLGGNDGDGDGSGNPLAPAGSLARLRQQLQEANKEFQNATTEAAREASDARIRLIEEEIAAIERLYAGANIDPDLLRLINITEARQRSMTSESARGSDTQFGSLSLAPGAGSRFKVHESIREAGERQAQAITDAYVGGFRAAEGNINEEALRTLAQNDIRARQRALNQAIAEEMEATRIALAMPSVRSQAFTSVWGGGFGPAEARSVNRTGALGDLGQTASDELQRRLRGQAQARDQRVNGLQGLGGAEAELRREALELAEAIRQGRVAIAADTVESQSFSFGRAEAMSVGRSGALSDRGKDGIFSNDHRAFNNSVTPLRRRNRRGDGGLAEAGEINAAREALERTQAQIDKMAGKGPSQFDVLRDAVEKFGQASGKSEDEIAALVAQVDELEKQDNLISTLEKVSSTLSTLGGAASGTPLGDALTGMGELVDIGMKFASGDILGGITAVAAEIVAGFTAASKAAQKLEDDLAGIQAGFDLIDTDQLVKKAREQVGTFFFLPIYGEVIDEAGSALALSVAEALEGGILSGLRRGFDAYLESGDLKDLENGLKDGFRAAVIDAIFEALIEGAIVEGALGQYLTELTAAIAAGDTDAANAAIDKINAEIPHLAELVADSVGKINIPSGAPSPDPEPISNPTGISIPVAPNPVMAAPAWVPELGASLMQSAEIYAAATDKFDRTIRGMNHSNIANDLLRSN